MSRLGKFFQFPSFLITFSSDFHFKFKHSETDTFCQEQCNPAAYPELTSEDGKGWYFNSSIAEQTNVWLGSYHSICREMLMDKYIFFLDEMILCRNRMTWEKLSSEGQYPNNWPYIDLNTVSGNSKIHCDD